MLELDEGQLSRPVLRGGGGGNVTSLPDQTRPRTGSLGHGLPAVGGRGGSPAASAARGAPGAGGRRGNAPGGPRRGVPIPRVNPWGMSRSGASTTPED